MSQIIIRVNPDRKDGKFKCSQCGNPFDTFEEGRKCAVKDLRRRGLKITIRKGLATTS